MLGKRRHFRVKGSFLVSWGIQNQPIEGEGVISNISLAGLDLTINKVFDPIVGSIFIIQPASTEVIPLQSKKAKMMWSKKISKDGAEYLQLGLEFIK